MALTQISTQGIKDGTITGADLATNVDLVDDQKIRFGNSQDLQIYVASSNNQNYIDAIADGITNIRADILVLARLNSDKFAKFTAGGSSELYFAGNKKFETTSYGAKWTGILLGADNQQLQLGSSGDLQLYHDGTNSYIDNANTGILRIRGGAGGSGRDIQIQAKNGEYSINAIPDGAVELYHDNSKKFETYSDGLKFYGNNIGQTAGSVLQVAGANSNAFAIGMTSGADSPTGSDNHLQFHHWNNSSWDKVFFVHRDYINIPDVKYIGFGNSNDLKLYHDGSESVIGNNTGTLQFLSPNEIRYRATTHHFLAYGNDESMAKFIDDGAVELYHDNVKRLETKSGGVDIFGQLAMGDNNKHTFGNSDDLQIYHDGTNSNIVNSTNVLTIQGNDIRLLNNGASKALIKAFDGGEVELYFNGSKKLKTINEGIKLTELQIAPSGTESNALINFGGGGMVTNSNSYGHFYDRATGGTNTTAVMFRSAGSQVGKIIFNNTSTLYQSGSSDRTLKKNFENWTETILTSFKNLNPQKFNYIQEEDTDSKHKGYIAQDLADKFPEAYPKDPETDKYGFNPSGMVVYLMKAIQELEAEVAALKAA